jgi:glycolate oxidase FAD binding subunit
MNRWAAKPMSLSATCYHDGVLTVRLSGASAAVRSVRLKLGGEIVEDGDNFWSSLREQQHAFFQVGSSKKSLALWRLSLPSIAPTLVLQGQQLIEWGGALRWLVSDDSAAHIRQAVAALGGQATLFRNAALHDQPFHPLSPALLRVHQRLKQSFDPHGIFNIGRMYPDF